MMMESKTSSDKFTSLEQLIAAVAETVRPTERLTVAEAAEKYRKLNNPGHYVGPWLNSTTPYLVEPMEVLTDLDYEAMVFVGPAQCGKTDIWQNWHLHSVICDQSDMMLIQTSQTTASDFSKRRTDRLHLHSPEVGARLMPGKNSDNTFDKRYLGNMMVTLSWPSINELSGKPIPRLFLTDYDRMDQDIDKNGEPFSLARKRATTFKRHGMTVVESSPSFPIQDPRWVRKSNHEAPPTEGILSIYNRGDRRRFYWQCSECQHWFEPDFSLLKWPDVEDPYEAGDRAWMECPHCSHHHTHDPSERSPGKRKLNQGGVWLRDGQIISPEGAITGVAIRSDIASFWLKGPAASFANWRTLVVNFLNAEEEYRRTQSENALITTTNVDQGTPYLPKSMESERLPEQLRDRSVELGYRVVPAGVRFLVAAIDVQKNRFVVQVHGIGEFGDMWIVDRYDIKYSRRMAEDEQGQKLWVNPFAYEEDWRLILTEVLLKTYPLSDGSGREMSIKQTLCDSGGGGKGTANSYRFYRWLKNGPGENDPDREDWPEWVAGLHGRFQLVKGASTKIAARVRLDFPDSQRKDRAAGARGEIPVLWINTNSVKDQVDQRLNRSEKGGGTITFPRWLDINFYKELCVEVKNHKNEWENPNQYRNESWDLLVYCEAGLISPRHIGVDRINWDDPPSWAASWSQNDLVFDPKGTSGKPFDKDTKGGYNLADLASKLG